MGVGYGCSPGVYISSRLYNNYEHREIKNKEQRKNKRNKTKKEKGNY
jgi:hypothetical protein